jgi:peptidoglycan/xylan/chitin deacetylase (PgdA/CDA1 family)
MASMTLTIPILLYHSVCDQPPERLAAYTVSRSQLASHLDRLVERGCSTLTVDEMVERLAIGKPLPLRPVVITFDDGFADFSTQAWPELRARGMQATLYMVAGAIGGRSDWLSPLGGGHLRMLNKQQLLSLVAEGCEVGAHSMSHPQLDCLPHKVAAREIQQSKDVLEQVLGQHVGSFAYPHGYHDREVKRMVVDAGFTSASAVRNALSHADDDKFALARVTVTSEYSGELIDKILSGHGIPVARKRERWRTRGWREVRKWRYRRASQSRPYLSATQADETDSSIRLR